MKEQQFSLICQLIRDSTIREVVLEANTLMLPPKTNAKRKPFEQYKYQSSENISPPILTHDYHQLQLKAEEQITRKVNQRMFDEEMARLRMEAFVTEHSIAIQKNSVQELKIGLKVKERVDRVEQVGKVSRRGKITPRRQYQMDKTYKESPIDKRSIYSLQIANYQPSNKQEQKLIIQKDKQTIGTADKDQHPIQHSQRDRLREWHLRRTQQLQYQLQYCQNRLRIPETNTNRKLQKRQCMDMIQNIWKEIGLTNSPTTFSTPRYLHPL